ncbi:MAG: glycosyltransferase [Aphanothece sp. CMT-3BRIN-NPC111]|jgi:cellulose synthase (UDP-forming)|nr:glycosyltransferase [Aphanothece sp. CMT-3BRIN-NPC111]
MKLKLWQVFLIVIFILFSILNVILLFPHLSSLSRQSYVLLPLVILITITLISRTIFPNLPPLWLRFLLTLGILTLHIRYLIWRVTETLVIDWYSGAISLAVIIMEFTAIVNVTIITFQTLRKTNNSPEADWRSQRIKEGQYIPSVDIFIPTYNEPTFVLRRTLVGCQAMRYPHKEVWVLDDGNRPEIAKLAKELKCKYLARSHPDHAKAGNLNYGLAATKGEIVVVFDADFIPLNNFLERTVGFFENSQIAMVVTPQNFYNPDPPELNLGGGILPHEQTVFYNVIQPGRDFSNSIICTGTSILIRRQHLNEVGGIPTSTIVEDWVTGMMLQSKAYKTIFINELLSVGAAPENLFGYLVQRVRWAEGTIKVLLSKYNPLFLPGFNISQRINHLSGIFYWIDQGTQTISYIAPALSLLLGMQALNTNMMFIIYYFLPPYIAGIILVPWLIGSRTILISYVYNALQCIPIANTVFKALAFPNKKNNFQVTPKGITSHKPAIALKLMRPLLFLLFINLGSILFAFYNSDISANATDTYTLSVLWAELNSVILVTSLLAGIGGVYSSEERIAPRVRFENPCEVIVSSSLGEETHFSSTIYDMSEYGVSFYTPTTLNLQVGQLLKLLIPGEPFQLLAKVRRVGKVTGCRFLISPLTPKQHQQLIEFVYCRPEHWKQPQVANEKQSLQALFLTLFELYPLRRWR